MTMMSHNLNKQPIYYATLSALCYSIIIVIFDPRPKSRDFRNYKNSVELERPLIQLSNCRATKSN